MKTQDEIREDKDQNKKRMSAIRAFFDKLKPVRGVAMTQEEYAAYKGRDVSGPDEPGPDVTDGMVNNEGMDNDESVDNDISQTNDNQPRQSMDEYKEEWVERFVQTKSVDERQHLMDELQKRRELHEHEEAFVEDFVNERDPDKREVLVNNLREKQSAYDESVSQSTYSPDRIKNIGRKSKVSDENLDVEEAYRRGFGVDSLGVEDSELIGEALRSGKVPQELRDRGIVSVEYAKKESRMDKIKGIFDKLKPVDSIGIPMEEYENISNDSVNSEMSDDGLDTGLEQSYLDPASEFDSMTDERKEELGYHPRTEYSTMAPHIREEWDARFKSEPETQNNSDIRNHMSDESILDRAGYVDVDMGDGTMAQARYSPEDTEIIKNKIRESMHLSDSDINDLGSLSDNQSMAANAGNMNDTESMHTSSIHLSASDIDDLSASQPSHQL